MPNEASLLVRQNEGGMEIEIRDTLKGLELELKGIAAGTEPAAFALRKPSQLVVDVPAQISQQFRQVVINHSELYSLRYGMRKGKTRFILDFRSTESPQFQILTPTDNAAVRIRFATRGLIFEELKTEKKLEKTPISPTESAPQATEVRLSAHERFAPAETERNSDKLKPLDVTQPARRFVNGDEPAVVLSPAILLIFGCSIMSLLAVLVLHRKKYGPKQVPIRPSNPFEDLEYCYALLGVSRESSYSEIKTSYRQLAKRYHSDRLVAEGGNIVQIRSAEAQFHKLQQAYERIKRDRGIN